MSAEVITQWVEALRSGEYKQGKHCLRDVDNQFCCLGVLCDLAVKAGILPEPVLIENKIYRYNSTSSVLPDEVRGWAGLKYSNGSFDGADWTAPDLISSLSLLNDDGKSFAKIADIIESKPKGLFSELV